MNKNILSTKRDEIIDIIDKEKLLHFLKTYYNTDKEDTIKKNLKRDIKEISSFIILTKKSDFDFEEIIYHLIKLFGNELFNKSIITKLRKNKKKYLKGIAKHDNNKQISQE